MLRWTLLASALPLLLLGTLTLAKSPPWSPWQFAVLAGEFGHWLALAALALAAGAWWARGAHGTQAWLTVGFATAAAVLLLRPAVVAAHLAGRLPGELTARFGAQPLDATPFSVNALFLGRDPAPVSVETLTIADGLPCDFYRPPSRAARGAVPCVIFVHGGGWDAGDRHQLPQFNHWLAGLGYAVAAVSYRLAPRFRWPAQRDDVLAAVAYLKSHAGELGIDPDRLILAGRSAGGQIAETVGYTAGDPAIRGVIALYAPSDLKFGYVNTHEDDMLKSPALMRQFLGGTPDSAPAAYASASAYLHVTPQAPATLLVHGANDALVWDRHSVRLDARLEEMRVRRLFVSLPWATHAFDFNLHGPGGQLTTFAVRWFLASVTRPHDGTARVNH